MKKQTLLLILSMCVFAVCASSARAGMIPTTFTPFDLSALVSAEATQYDLAEAAWLLDKPLHPQKELGNWTGNVNADGWSLNFQGNLNGVPLTVTQTGHLDLANDMATWTDFGLLGGEPINGSGTINFDPNWTQLLSKVGFDVVVAGAQIAAGVVSGGVLIAINTLVSVAEVDVGGALIDEAFESGAKVKKPADTTKPVLMESFGRSSHDSLVPLDIIELGSIDQASGAASLRASSVPDSGSTLTLLGFASACLFAFRRLFAFRKYEC